MKWAVFWLSVVGALLLSACGADTPSDAAGTSAVPTAAVAPTSAPAAEATTAPTESPATEATAAAAAASTSAPAASTGAMQTFTIMPDQSKVSYEVGEVFFNQGNRYAVAIGTTQDVSGEITFDSANPQNSKVGTLVIDISTFQSDNSRRDNAIRSRWLESATFPKAEFTPTQIEGLPASYTPGQEITLTITGDLKVRDVTKPTVFTVTGKIENNTMTGVATSQIKMSDFGFEAPNIAGILKAEDDVKIRFEFVATP